MFRVSLAGMWRPAARLAFLAELRSEDAQRVIPYAALRPRPALAGPRVRRPGRPHPAGVRRVRAADLRRRQSADRLSPRLPVPDLAPAGRRALHRRRSAGDAGARLARRAIPSARSSPPPVCRWSPPTAGTRACRRTRRAGASTGRSRSPTARSRTRASTTTTADGRFGPHRLEAARRPGPRRVRGARPVPGRTSRTAWRRSTDRGRGTTQRALGVRRGVLARLLDCARRGDRQPLDAAGTGARPAIDGPVSAPRRVRRKPLPHHAAVSSPPPGPTGSTFSPIRGQRLFGGAADAVGRARHPDRSRRRFLPAAQPHRSAPSSSATGGTAAASRTDLRVRSDRLLVLMHAPLAHRHASFAARSPSSCSASLRSRRSAPSPAGVRPPAHDPRPASTLRRPQRESSLDARPDARARPRDGHDGARSAPIAAAASSISRRRRGRRSKSRRAARAHGPAQRAFVPHVLAIVAGTWVDFPNSDATYHNVFSLSKAQRFNLGRYAAGRSKAVRFERPGIVRVFCDIHSHMSAFILVFAHRYFAVTDDEGRYRLDGVPPGTYTVAVWNEPSTAIRRGARSRSARPAARSTPTSASDEPLLLAHQPHLRRHGAAGGAVDRRRDLHRQSRRDEAGASASCSAASTKPRPWSTSTGKFSVRDLQARGAPDRRPAGAQGRGRHARSGDRRADRARVSEPARQRGPVRRLPTTADRPGAAGDERRAGRGARRRGDHRDGRRPSSAMRFWPEQPRDPADQVGPDLDRSAPARRARDADPRRELRLPPRRPTSRR